LGRFATTQWSVVLRARSPHEAESRDALATLCQAYWPPVFSYIRHLGHDPEEARDLTQEFFADILERRGIADARKERGRFRSFLLSSVKHFLADEHDRRTAAKRGGGRASISIDAETFESLQATRELATHLTPEAIFERRWAQAVVERVRRDLDREMERSGSGERFRRLHPHLVGDANPPYGQLAADLGMTESAVRVALHRLRQRFGAKLREHVAQTVDDPGKADDEVRHLIQALSA
jgi:RNA polymerase sigma-70 factor (ECF subfamily)